MAQYEANRAMVRSLCSAWRGKAHFTGLFCQISDPVDPSGPRLSFCESNRNADRGI